MEKPVSPGRVEPELATSGYDGILPGKGPGWYKAWWALWLLGPWPVTALVGLWRLIAGARAPGWCRAVFLGWLGLAVISTTVVVLLAATLIGENDERLAGAQSTSAGQTEQDPSLPCYPVEVDTISGTYRGHSLIAGPEGIIISGDQRSEIPRSALVAIRTSNCPGMEPTVCEKLYVMTDSSSTRHLVTAYTPIASERQLNPEFYQKYQYYWLTVFGENKGYRWGTNYPLTSVGQGCAPGGASVNG